jgi:hypothetical protein
VLYFSASFLKKSTLVLLSEIVILTVSSLSTSSSGEGRKSVTTFTFPIRSSVYFIFLFINPLSFPPESGADDPDLGAPVGKPYRQNIEKGTGEQGQSSSKLKGESSTVKENSSKLKGQSSKVEEP